MISSVSGTENYFPTEEMNALFDLYESAHGSSWIWYMPYIHFGYPWNFTDFTDGSLNPCINPQPWQGIQCSEDKLAYQVQNLSLSGRNLRGVLQSSIGKLTQLLNLDLSSNELEGSIPSSIGNLVLIKNLNLYSNQLNGSIPSSIGNLNQMENLALYNNNLTGSIPSSIGNLVQMENLALYGNKLSGSIPSSIGNLTQMEFLLLDTNQLTGSIPSSIGNLVQMENLALYDNNLSGSIPSSIGNLTQMEFLAIDTNQLTGSIPSSIGNLVQMEYLTLNTNQLTGSITRKIGNLKSISFMHIFGNNLIGSIPVEILNATSLQILDISSNILSGNINSNWSALNRLQQAFFQNNKFDGSISINLPPLLTTIDFSNNKLTGTIPFHIFQSHNLQSFAAVENCFSGSISEVICNCKSLQVLALDGLSAASNCPKQMNNFNSYFNLLSSQRDPSVVHGSIPRCLYLMMPNLTTLHLAGNGLTGTISGSLNNSYISESVLSDVSLSHNHLTGTIPIEWQLRSWQSALDLSSNFFNGILSDDFPLISNYQNLSLDLNQLSGKVPKNLLKALNINILAGSIFYCGVDTQNYLPINDPNWSNYQCGSNNFDASIYLWLVLFSISMIVFLIVFKCEAIMICNCNNLNTITIKNFTTYCSEIKRNLIMWFKYFYDQKQSLDDLLSSEVKDDLLTLYDNLQLFGLKLNQIRRIMVILTVYLSVVMMVVYYILTDYYGSYKVQYGWTVSAGYLRGETAALIMMIFLIIFMIIYLSLWYKFSDYIIIGSYKKNGLSNTTSSSFLKYKYFTCSYYYSTMIMWIRSNYVLYLIINTIITIAINGAYVYGSVHLGESTLIIVALIVTIAKIIWRKVVLYLLFPFEKISFKFFVAFFLNNIIIPSLVTAFIKYDCFYYVIFSPPQIETSFQYSVCEEYLVLINENSFTCISYGFSIGSTLFTPKFQYSYQCSASLLNNYAYVYVFDLIIRGFIYPFIIMIAYSFSGNSYDEMNMIMKVMIPKTLKPLNNHLNYSKQTNRIESIASNGNNSLCQPKKEDFGVASHNNNDDRLKNTSFQKSISKSYSTVIDVDEFVLGLTSSITILMTYGAIFPPIAPVALIGIYSESYFLQMKIGRFVTEITKLIINAQTNTSFYITTAASIITQNNNIDNNNNNNNKNNNNNNKNNNDLHQNNNKNNSSNSLPIGECNILTVELNELIISIGYLIWPIFYITGFFYSFFIFDTYGFGKNFDKALIASIFVTLLPLLIKLCLDILDWFLLYHNKKGQQANESTLSKNNDNVIINISIIPNDNNSFQNNHNNINLNDIILSPLNQFPLDRNDDDNIIEMNNLDLNQK
eukprot:gene12517-16788_t